MRYRWLLDSRELVIIVLSWALAILVGFGGAYAWHRGNQRTTAAQQIIAQTDSLMRDWVSRGCAPRSKSLP